jgi:hypothetical protein
MKNNSITIFYKEKINEIETALYIISICCSWIVCRR